MTSSYPAVAQAIAEYFAMIDRTAPTISPSTNFLNDLGIDSIALAVIVINLQDTTGKDPFADGFRNFHTVQELADLFDSIPS